MNQGGYISVAGNGNAAEAAYRVKMNGVIGYTSAQIDKLAKKKKEEVEAEYIKAALPVKKMKSIIKDHYPNVTMGMNNGVINSISVSANTSGNVQNTLLATAISGKAQGIDGVSALVDEEELLVIPSTLSLTCMGLPIIQRGNQLYVDMGTGTTLDNIYVVTNVSHSISSGDFSTTISLTNTGQGTADSLRRVIKKAVDIKSIQN